MYKGVIKPDYWGQAPSGILGGQWPPWFLLHCHYRKYRYDYYYCMSNLIGPLVCNILPSSSLLESSHDYPNCNGRADLFVQPHTNSNTYHNSFFPSTILQWNWVLFPPPSVWIPACPGRIVVRVCINSIPMHSSSDTQSVSCMQENIYQYSSAIW